MEPVCSALSFSPGAASVILYIESTKKKLRAPDSLNANPSDSLLAALRDMLGGKNVVLK